MTYFAKNGFKCIFKPNTAPHSSFPYKLKIEKYIPFLKTEGENIEIHGNNK